MTPEDKARSIVNKIVESFHKTMTIDFENGNVRVVIPTDKTQWDDEG